MSLPEYGNNFQQDGATPCCTRDTLDVLKQFFDNHHISRNSGFVTWLKYMTL
jgi:hypothetical protein